MHVPQQNNGVDCGMFVLLACLHISQGLPLIFKQADITYWRHRAAIEILSGSLFPLNEAKLLDDSVEDPKYVCPKYETESESEEIKSVRPKRKVRSELKKIEWEKLRCQVLNSDETILGLEVQETSDGRGRGVFTLTEKRTNDFICEYVGELCSRKEAERRADDYFNKEMKEYYLFYFSTRGKCLCIDATVDSGRFGRLLNHTRLSPNCKPKLLIVDGDPRIVLLACRDIGKNTECVFDYGDRSKASLLAHPWLASLHLPEASLAQACPSIIDVK
jgi:histone-lysine N-methyltransferase SETD8